MNTKSKFDSLTFATRYMMNGALSRINDEKRGIQTISNNIEQIANTLSWNAEDWMTASFELQYANWAAKALELALLEVMEANGPGPQSDFDAALEIRAAAIIQQIASECLSTVYRGADRTSNPMTILESGAKVNAARKAMEALCDLSSYAFSTHEVIGDIIAGKERRAEERRDFQRQIPRSIRYFKKDRCDGGDYMAIAYNSDQERVSSRDFDGVTRKGDALTKVAEWIKEIRAQYPNQHLTITTEAV